jgi:hypothetical protein
MNEMIKGKLEGVPVSAVLTMKGSTQKRLRDTTSARVLNGFKFDPSMLSAFLGELLRERIRLINPNRRIVVSADMFVEDHESFGSNETVRRQQTNAGIISTLGLAQTIMNFEVRMGGEIRVEFAVTASLMDNNGNAMIDGEIKLFEGTSESTGDLDGVRQFQLYVPAGAVVNHFVRVNNDDEGDDYATVRLTITNEGV